MDLTSHANCCSTWWRETKVKTKQCTWKNTFISYAHDWFQAKVKKWTHLYLIEYDETWQHNLLIRLNESSDMIHFQKVNRLVWSFCVIVSSPCAETWMRGLTPDLWFPVIENWDLGKVFVFIFWLEGYVHAPGLLIYLPIHNPGCKPEQHSLLCVHIDYRYVWAKHNTLTPPQTPLFFFFKACKCQGLMGNRVHQRQLKEINNYITLFFNKRHGNV